MYLRKNLINTEFNNFSTFTKNRHVYTFSTCTTFFFMKLYSTSSQITIYKWKGILSFYWNSYYIITFLYQYHPSINYTINAFVLTSFSTCIKSSVYYLYIFITPMTTFFHFINKFQLELHIRNCQCKMNLKDLNIMLDKNNSVD